MSLRVRLDGGGSDNWSVVSDDRHWFDYTHAVDGDDLVVFQHTFRRGRDRGDRTHDTLAWKHHTTKVVRRYSARSG